MATKTPVSILRELCVKQNIEERYSVVSSYGPPNDPTFEMSVETNTGLKAIGKGKKKKEAQHNAAQALLLLIRGSSGTAAAGIASISNPVSVPVMRAPASAITTEGIENAVGRLQEYCQKENWGIPNYTLVSRQGDSHQPTFTMQCEAGNLSALGCSRTKQQAKQEAAHKLYQQIVSSPGSLIPAKGSHLLAPAPSLVPAPVSKLTTREKEAVIEKYALCKPLTGMHTTKPNLKFGAYHTSMQDVLSKVRAELDTQNFSSPVTTLKSLAEKLCLRISYHEGRDLMAQDTRSEKCFVYVVVTTQPTTVQVGDGDSMNVATEQAALSVLKYWQTFLGIFPVM